MNVKLGGNLVSDHRASPLSCMLKWQIGSGACLQVAAHPRGIDGTEYRIAALSHLLIIMLTELLVARGAPSCLTVQNLLTSSFFYFFFLSSAAVDGSLNCCDQLYSNTYPNRI
jgi:hypothetical protein